MALGTSNRDGGKTSESGHLRALAKAFTGDVFSGLQISQRAAGVNMSVDLAVGDTLIRRSDNTYAHPCWNDELLNVPIGAADPSNPRRDLIVMYVDYAEDPDPDVSNNTNGVVKVKVVPGTAAGSPADPNGAAVQASVGSGNPYTILGRARVGAGVTSLANAVIDDLRTMATPVYAPGDLMGSDGYFVSPDVAVYVSANSFKIVGKDVRSRWAKGTKVWLDQSGSKFFYVALDPTMSGSDTLVTIFAGTDYTLANAAINNLKYSYSNPPNFPGTFNYDGGASGSIKFVKGSTGLEQYTFSMDGRRVRVKGYILPNGSGIDFGAGGVGITVPLPITISAAAAALTRSPAPLGSFYADNVGIESWMGAINYNNTTTVVGFIANSSGDGRVVQWSSTKPFGANAGDTYNWEFAYDS